MPRLLIYDNAATVNSRRAAVSMTMSQAAASPVRSVPFRLFSVDGAFPRFSLEFMMSAIYGTAVVAPWKWWMEYFCDEPGLSTPPANRVWEDVNVASPWMREVLDIDAGAGQIDEVPVTRRLELRLLADETIIAVSRHVVVEAQVYAAWGRVAMWMDTDIGQELSVPDLRFRIFAHVEAHDEVGYIKENAAYPYAYNAR